MVSIIDYGAGNIKSLTNAFLTLGETASIAKTTEDIKKARKLVLPGVGSFGFGIAKLENLIDDIQDKVIRGTPILGICLGMHLLADGGDEDGPCDGMFLLPGRVVKLPCETLPHVGWNNVSGLEDNFYFQHSYYLDAEFKDEIVGLTQHERFSFPAVIARDNIMGCQFHPEKSGHAGMTFLRTWLRSE